MRRVVAAVGVGVLLIASACASPAPSPSSAGDQTSLATLPADTTPQPSSHAPGPSMTPPAKLTPAIMAKVRAILTNNLSSYTTAFLSGVAVVSTKHYTLAGATALIAHPAFGASPYADADAGLAAFSDPSSPAALFSAWQTAVWHPLQGSSSYLAAFEQADAYFTADDEPASIEDWRGDTIQLDSDIGTWTQTATSWQISEVTSGVLDADTATVTADLAAVKHDIIEVAAGH